MCRSKNVFLPPPLPIALTYACILVFCPSVFLVSVFRSVSTKMKNFQPPRKRNRELLASGPLDIIEPSSTVSASALRPKRQELRWRPLACRWADQFSTGHYFRFEAKEKKGIVRREGGNNNWQKKWRAKVEK